MHPHPSPPPVQSPFRPGDRVVKNPATWRPSEFDGWGAGIGVGVVEAVESAAGPGDPIVDVRWPGGRCFQGVDELIVCQRPTAEGDIAMPKSATRLIDLSAFLMRPGLKARGWTDLPTRPDDKEPTR